MGKESVKDIQEIWQDLLSLLSQMGYENISPESTPKSLGIDSLDSIEIIMKIESMYGIHLEDSFIGADDSLLVLAERLREKI